MNEKVEPDPDPNGTSGARTGARSGASSGGASAADDPRTRGAESRGDAGTYGSGQQRAGGSRWAAHGSAELEEERVLIDLDAKEQRLYDRLRSQLVAPRPGEPSGVRDLLLLLPDLAVLLGRLAREPRVPLMGKLTALAAMGYVLSPIDLIPEILGPIGFVDDFLIVSAALSRLMNDVHPDVLRYHWSGQGDVLIVLQRVTEWSESMLRRALPGPLQRLLGR